MTQRPATPMRNAFTFFRKVWGPRAAYHLARVRFGAEWQDRLASVSWLAREQVPYSGAAPSMSFRGLPRNFGA